ncbi:alpha-hydroxy acid oxidase [Palleronia sp. KMU-117]|uniref:alpha-hydroxy acid oxidase n=1 Tax=Palleronia sp. KMU-117 TaxID=3434108 RepID=UPI003D73EA58
MDLDYRFPALSDLRDHARRRIPHYLWEYLDNATGDEGAKRRAEAALDAVELLPGVLAGEVEPVLETTLLGRGCAAPIGIAPVGMSGAVWPDAERLLARTAAQARIPYCLSTVAAVPPEEIAGAFGDMGWFQLYAPADPAMRRDVLARARAAGFHTLILTVDVPVLSRREREMRVNIRNPMPLTPSVLLQSALRPAWAWGMLGRPIPRPRLFDKYADTVTKRAGDKHIGLSVRCAPDWDYLDALRAEWDGPLVIKGVLDPAAVPRLLAAGADALWVSNHGGRQFQAAPTPVAQLPLVRAAASPEVPIIADGAVRSGTDVLRLIALGADFVMLGRAFHHGLAAAGEAGAAHVVHLLVEQMKIDMAQLAIARPVEARGRLRR